MNIFQEKLQRELLGRFKNPVIERYGYWDCFSLREPVSNIQLFKKPQIGNLLLTDLKVEASSGSPSGYLESWSFFSDHDPEFVHDAVATIWAGADEKNSLPIGAPRHLSSLQREPQRLDVVVEPGAQISVSISFFSSTVTDYIERRGSELKESPWKFKNWINLEGWWVKEA